MAPRRVIIATLLLAATVAGCGDGGGGGGDAATRSAAATVAPEEPADHTVSAIGVGRASAPPDTMVVSLSIHTEGASAAETMDTTSLRTRQLIDTARRQGVAEEDLQTTNVSVYPRYNQTGTRVIGYGADNSFTVRYRDLATAGGLLDELVGVGGDFLAVQGLSLEIDDTTAVLEEARADAVARARDQGRQLADAAEVELGAVLSVTEVPVGTTVEEAQAFAGAARAASDAAVPVPVAGGSLEFSVQVLVVFDIG